MSPPDLIEKLREALPPAKETERLLAIAVDRLPASLFNPEYREALDSIADALGSYLALLWKQSMPPVDREIALRLAPIEAVEDSIPGRDERELALDEVELLLKELPPSREWEQADGEVERLRRAWAPVEARALIRRLRRRVVPRIEANARAEALRRAVHRLSLPMAMLARELPRYLEFVRRSNLHFPPSAFGWQPREGRWFTPNWDGLEEMQRLLEREPTVERLARAIALPSTRSTAGKLELWMPSPKPEREQRPGKHAGSLTVDRRPGRITELGEMLLQRRRRLLEEVVAREMEEISALSEPPRDEGEQTRESAPQEATDSPLVLVLDTSGSMRGEPEKVARALVFGMLRHALSRGRPVWLETFSTAPRTYHLDPELPDLGALPDFLNEGFRHGGAAVPALRDALRRGLQEAWNRADIVFVTDSREPRLSPGTETQLEELRRRGDFILHGLAVNELPMSNPGNLFDFTWHYANAFTLRPGIDSGQFRQL